MRIYKHFPYTGKEQRWVVPTGVTEAQFECWGAAGGMPSDLSFEGKKREVVGGTAPRNDSFFNDPNHQGQLGVSFANNAGYAAGIRTVSDGEVYYVYVGGNGGPGHSTIKLKDNGNYEVAFRGGAGGYNGGGSGGQGAHVYQNLYDSTSTNVHYTRATLPPAAKVGQLWHDTANDLVKKCNTTYTSGGAANSKWDKVTHTHSHAAGPSGGGGGGATDIRKGGNDITNRILVAGGGGGAGGQYNKTGAAAWTLRQVPASPAPPFGNDDISTGPTGPDKTWATGVNYLVGGWGGGGIGGSGGPKPNPSPTTDGGYATAGDSGGPATDRHKDGTAPGTVNGSGGHGGTNDAGGARGHGGSGGQDGSKGQGGNGADASGGKDDWCAGGGGGGGGFYGGGGGGQGFKVSGNNGDVHTRSGGGGGGSNYADNTWSQFFLGGCAQPPFAKGNSGTGANGLGGFARVTYHLPPKVKWTTAPAVADAGASFGVAFKYAPAETGGAGISYYVLGTATSPTATFPTSQTTYMVTDSTLTDFTGTFTAPANNVEAAYFVQVVDTDGDASDWLRLKVTGLTPPTPPTITAPAAGSAFENSVTVTWTVGGQSPQVAYRIGVTGTRVTSQQGAVGVTVDSPTGWRRGGTRVNLALDPGFQGTSVWSSTANANLTSSTDHPGVSGHCGKIAWNLADDGSAEQHTTVFDNLVPGTAYRLHLGVTSALTNDPRPVEVQVWDDNGRVATAIYDLSATTAGTYVVKDIEFTPLTQNAYVVVLPSSIVASASALVSDDFEDGTVGTWTAMNSHTLAVDGTNAYQGSYALYIHNGTGGADQAAQRDVTASLAGAGWYFAQARAFVSSGADHSAVLRVIASGSGNPIGVDSTLNAPVFLRVPFYWDGTGTVDIQVDGATSVGDFWYDLIEVYPADTTGAEASFGDADNGQITYLSDMLVELKYEEDASGYGAYFDGTNANGTGLTVSWRGTANASASYATGTDVVTDTFEYDGAPLSGGSLYLVTLNRSDVALGHTGVKVSEAITVNPSAPPAPTVTLTFDNAKGLAYLSIDAADGAATYKTVYFDVYRGSTRIATNLVPDQTTRLAALVDLPASGETAAYTVRAFDAIGGWADQTTGTVTYGSVTL